MPKNIPVFFASGCDDPVGEYGKGVQRSVKTFKKAGMKNVSVKLYPKDRHEILHETDRNNVYEDLYFWIKDRIV